MQEFAEVARAVKQPLHEGAGRHDIGLLRNHREGQGFGAQLRPDPHMRMMRNRPSVALPLVDDTTRNAIRVVGVSANLMCNW